MGKVERNDTGSARKQCSGWKGFKQQKYRGDPLKQIHRQMNDIKNYRKEQSASTDADVISRKLAEMNRKRAMKWVDESLVEEFKKC